jgi:hypothetical protein
MLGNRREGGTGLLHPKRLARTHSHGFRTPAVRAAYRTYSPFWYLPGGGKFRQIPCSHPARPSRLPTRPPPPPPSLVPPLPTVALDFGGGPPLSPLSSVGFCTFTLRAVPGPGERAPLVWGGRGRGGVRWVPGGGLRVKIPPPGTQPVVGFSNFCL